MRRSTSLFDSLSNTPLSLIIALISFSKVSLHSLSYPSSRDGSCEWTDSATHFAAITPPPIEVAIPPAVVGLTCPADSPTHTSALKRTSPQDHPRRWVRRPF